MIKIDNTKVMGWEAATRGMRNPMNSWEKRDSGYGCKAYGGVNHCSICESGHTEECSRYAEEYIIGPNDLKLMTALCNAGTDHRKFMRMIVVYCDITAPLYWWKEFKTYRAGRKFGDDEPDIIDDGYLEYDIEMNSCSTMHKIADKEFTLEDFSHEHLNNFMLNSLNGTIDHLNLARRNYLETKNKDWWWQMIQLLPSSYNQRRTVMLNYEVLANMYKSRKDHKLDEWHAFCGWIKEMPYSELITGEFDKKGEA